MKHTRITPVAVRSAAVAVALGLALTACSSNDSTESSASTSTAEQSSEAPTTEQPSTESSAAETSAASVAAAAAARAVDARGIADAGFEIGCAKVTAGEAAAKGAAIAHQVLAAMGITEEHTLHHLTRRLWSWREEGGAERFWSARIGAMAQAAPGPLWSFLTSRDQEPAA